MAKGKKGKSDSAKSRNAVKKVISEKKKKEIDDKIYEAFKIFDTSGNKTCQTNEIGTILRYLNLFPSEEKLKEWLKQMEEDEPTGYIVYDKFYQIVFPLLTEDAPPAFDTILYPLPPLPKPLPTNTANSLIGSTGNPSSDPNTITTDPNGLPTSSTNSTGPVPAGSTALPSTLPTTVTSTVPLTEPKKAFYFKGLEEQLLFKAFQTLDKEGKGYLAAGQLQTLLTTEGDPLLKEEMEDMLLACVDENENKIYYADYVNVIANMIH